MDEVINVTVRAHGDIMEYARGYRDWIIFTRNAGTRDVKSKIATIHMSRATVFSRCNITDICCEATASPSWKFRRRIANSILIWLTVGTTRKTTKQTTWAMKRARAGRITWTRTSTVYSDQITMAMMAAFIAPAEKRNLGYLWAMIKIKVCKWWKTCMCRAPDRFKKSSSWDAGKNVWQLRAIVVKKDGSKYSNDCGDQLISRCVV